MSALFPELKIKFLSSNNGVGRSIAKYSSLQHALKLKEKNKCELLEIKKQNLRFQTKYCC